MLDLDDDAIGSGLDAVPDATGGRLDALFNNGAYGQPGAVEIHARRPARAVQTNLFRDRGADQSRDSGHAIRAPPHRHEQLAARLCRNGHRGAYNASKFALEGLTDTLRLELAGSGIHVSLIEPGPITSRFRANAEAAFHRHIDPAGSVHRAAYVAMAAERLARPGPLPLFTLGPEGGARQKLVHALSPASAPLSGHGTGTYAFWWLRRLLPFCLIDRILAAAGSGRLNCSPAGLPRRLRICR